jgi:hypothetical protein
LGTQAAGLAELTAPGAEKAGTVNGTAAVVPEGVVKVTLPVVAPAGTVTLAEL